MALATKPVQEHKYLEHRQIVMILPGLMLGMLLAALDQFIVSTALPTIVGDLGGANHYTWVVAAYLLTSTASTPLYGKISDLYGRKGVFQIAIVVFLIGSALCGLSQSMLELILFRGLQGLGAGGLMSLAMSIVGDIVPPRQRGKYQGYFGAVFAVASVAGPLVGGFLVDQLSWRWVFYVNVPIGIVALIVTTTALNFPFPKREHKIDYLGSLLMVTSVSALLLVSVWGGSQYSWGSPIILSMIVVGIVFGVSFVFWEFRAPEPILPPSLFKIDVFSVASAMTFLLAGGMFGAIVFLPEYLQLVHNLSATLSGLALLPMMVGIIGASMGSGQIVTRIGRYKVFPIIGSVLMTVGMIALSTIKLHSSTTILGIEMFVFGIGVGLTMQIMVLATQNAVDPRDMGTATSGISFFRSLGGAFGTAIFGAVLIARMRFWIPELLPRSATEHMSSGSSLSGLLTSPQQFQKIPTLIRIGVEDAFARSLHTVFTIGIPITVAVFVLSLLLREVKLRTAGSPSKKGGKTRDSQAGTEGDENGAATSAIAEETGFGGPPDGQGEGLEEPSALIVFD